MVGYLNLLQMGLLMAAMCEADCGLTVILRMGLMRIRARKGRAAICIRIVDKAVSVVFFRIHL